jgi:predicted branched-subunit amino acid permease
MLFGVVPFGLVAGASPVAQGLGPWSAVGFSTVVFAGASQLAAIDVLGQGGSALVAILTAWTINLRMVLYSASLAPFLTHEPPRRRLAAAYVLTDQAYAVSITRWARSDDVEHRLPYYLGAALLLWGAWQMSTVAGVFLGEAVPDEVHLDFAVPLVFLVLLVPVLTTRPAVVAAVAGGFGAVAAAEAGAGPLSVILGCALGIAAGAVVEARASGPA